MTVRVHFETLASGMKAKLDPRYRDPNNCVHNGRKLGGSGFSAGVLEDSLGKYRPKLIGRNK